MGGIGLASAEQKNVDIGRGSTKKKHPSKEGFGVRLAVDPVTISGDSSQRTDGTICWLSFTVTVVHSHLIVQPRRLQANDGSFATTKL
jgi:hypothetical protein